MEIREPLKAQSDPITDEQLQKIAYPVYASPKLDGFCASIWDGPRSPALKLVANEFVCRELSKPEFHGLHGELIVGNPADGISTFNKTSSALRSHKGEPDFRFYVFDHFVDANLPYDKRWIERYFDLIPEDYRIVPIPQSLLYKPEDVIRFEKKMVDMGYEGAMIRSPKAQYKFGRATFLEDIIHKRKPFSCCEGRIVGFVEMVEQKTKKPKGILGKFIVSSPNFTETFGVGTGYGLDHKTREDIWNNRFMYLDRWIRVRYQVYGSTTQRPRIPSFAGFRPEWDFI